MARLRCLIPCLAALALGACKPASPEAGPSAASPEPARPDAISVIKGSAPGKSPTLPRSSAPPPAEIWKEFSGDKAFEATRQQVELGPRPSGTPELEKARVLIEEALRHAGWETERQVFTTDTPHGPIEFTNLIARFSATGTQPAPRNTQRAIVCSHYDTKRFSTISFVGADDGASSTGALLELARVLALDPALAAQIELVFFDGEEALVQFTAPDDPKPDGLFGSRYYARKLADEKRAGQFKFAILWDMIGDSDLRITLPPDSPPDLARPLLSSADALGLRDHFRYLSRGILDDHEELQRIARIPSIDLIDFDYIYWHTRDDTLEHISGDSLQKVGAVTLHYLKQALGK